VNEGVSLSGLMLKTKGERDAYAMPMKARTERIETCMMTF
jgi:hypothetical protein